jgi:hypothetical protein
MNTQPTTVQDAPPNPTTTPEALAVKEVAVIMKTVCKGLGWKADAPSDGFNHVYMKAQLDEFPSSYASFSYGRYPYEGRITITAYSKHDSSLYRYGEKHLSISVSATRSADQILKEIQRRFLPAFLENAKKAEEIQKREDEYHRQLEACMGRLKGESLEESEKRNGKVQFSLEDIWGEVQYGSDDQLAIDFHNVPVEKVGRILAILRESSSKEESRLSGSERRSNHE